MKNFFLSYVCLITIFQVSVLASTYVDIVGIDENRGQYWRSTNYDKPDIFDPSGDNAYGTDGYYCIQSATSGGARTVLQSLPSYISTVIPDGSLSTYSGYAQLDSPTQSIGANISNMPYSGLWYRSGTANTYYKYFTITLAEEATFILTAILDTHNSNYNTYGSPGVKIVGPGGISSELSPLSANGVPDYAFFKISGSVGDSFQIWLKTTSTGGAAMAGIGFEQTSSTPPIEASLLGYDVQVKFQTSGNRIVLADISDPSNGVSFLPNSSTIWRIRVKNNGNLSEVTSSNSCESVSLTSESGHITALWNGISVLGVPIFDVAVDVNLAIGSRLPTWNLSVTNVASGYAVYEVDFPAITLKQLSQGGDEDYLVFPWVTGRLIKDPTGMTSTLAGEYPGRFASIQMMSYYSPDLSGLYLTTPDSNMYIKTFTAVASTDQQSLDLRITHLPPNHTTTGQFYTIPYNIVLGTFDGNWWAASIPILKRHTEPCLPRCEVGLQVNI